MTDTVYAPSSAIGGAVAVFRVSGPECRRVACEMLSRDITVAPGRLLHCYAMDGEESLDDCMAVFFAAPRSYTGEDMLEIHTHGGPATVSAILNRLRKTGARPAPGGEFTKRAFMNGKMDLSRAEAVMDLVTACAEGSRKAALRQLQGGLEKQVVEAEEMLINALSAIDAAIDYPDEMEDNAEAEASALVKEVLGKTEALVSEGKRGRVLRSGITVALAGRPNAGKSSLLNCLLGEERAIVTDLPGTTRDILNEQTAFDGVPVRLIDTAGIRETGDRVERIGVERAKKALESADIVLVLLDGTRPVQEEDKDIIALSSPHKHILVRTKADLPQSEEQFGELTVSSVTGCGIEQLKKQVLALAGPGDADGTITNERHTEALEQAAAALRDALSAPGWDCMATDIRTALHFLGSVSGREADNAVIDRIFSRFCVGK